MPSSSKRGLSDDQEISAGFENCQLVSIMPYTGVRESRRLVGKKKLTLQDVLALNIPEDTVAIAGYNRDTHSPKDGQMHLLAVEHGVGIPTGVWYRKMWKGF